MIVCDIIFTWRRLLQLRRLHHRHRHSAFVHLACVTCEMKYLTGWKSGKECERRASLHDMLNCCLPAPRINACMHVRRTHRMSFSFCAGRTCCTICNLNLFYLILCCLSHASCAAERWCVFVFLMNVSACLFLARFAGRSWRQSSLELCLCRLRRPHE